MALFAASRSAAIVSRTESTAVLTVEICLHRLSSCTPGQKQSSTPVAVSSSLPPNPKPSPTSSTGDGEAAATMPPLVSALIDDLVEDILLRLPPDDPGCLFRAAVVCKRWRGLLTGRAFARRYRKFHRFPPLLGFFENQLFGCWFSAPSSLASPVPPIHPGHRRLDALDSRHGLVLLDVMDSRSTPLYRFAVWDPLRRRQWEFPFPELAEQLGFRDLTYSAAVLCAADGCDHLDCRAGGGHFLVACVCSEDKRGFYASLYSSEARAWSPATSCDCEHSAPTNLNCKPKVLVGNALYFTFHCKPSVMIVRYDLAGRELSIINAPAGSQANRNQYVLVGTDNGVLGFANVQGSMLCVWSIEASANGRTVAWGQPRVVELEKLLPPHVFSAEIYLTGFTEGVGVIVLTNAGTFTIELESGRAKNVPGRILHSFPFSSFYTPDQAGGIIPHLPMASSENSEVGRDLLLQQPSMGTSEDREEDDDDEEEGKCKEDDDDKEEGEWKEDDDDKESGEELADDLEQAHDMFVMWSKAIAVGDFGLALIFAVSTLDCRFSCHGKLSPKCAYTYYIYGCTLLYRPQPDIEPSSERDDVKDVMSLPGNHDFDPAWKMLHIARTILEKCPGSSMEKVKIFSALADVKILATIGRASMRLEDKDYSLGVCFKALAISEHLMEPDNYWIIKLNISICLIFELASNIGDAVMYCAKAISLCNSRICNLKNASAAEAGPERSPLDYEMDFLTGLACKLEKKLEHLEQVKPTPTTKASDEQNVGDAMPRAASSTPVSKLLELLSIFDPVLLKTGCTPIWPELQDV
ncbi:unnamed protein product [Alopecurus aequalis]